MAEPAEILFGTWTWVGQRNHVLGGGPAIPWEGVIMGTYSGRHRCVGAVNILNILDIIRKAAATACPRSINSILFTTGQ